MTTKQSNDLKKDYEAIQQLSQDINQTLQSDKGVIEIVEKLPEYMERFEQSEQSYQSIKAKLDVMKQKINTKDT